ncbi:hypothetical protein CTEN210_03997 [Chaetoceros tenuissimus]|uniref:Uncharacterized protein n=1 Tax=Chaetoceros tenuissimus TaxID=426638 RepID=A0AAD3H1V8_9STRA|nr:hypothetical protein CTEN210_03997 [Chaetoceros tenuissimus]
MMRLLLLFALASTSQGFSRHGYLHSKSFLNLPIHIRGGSEGEATDVEEKASQKEQEIDPLLEVHDFDNVEIIPFDSEDDDGDYVVIEEDEHGEVIHENVEIIPFDSEYDVENVLMDDRGSVEIDDRDQSDEDTPETLIDEGEESETQEADTLPDMSENDSKAENIIEISDEDSNESREEPPTHVESKKKKVATRKSSGALRERILSLLSTWKRKDYEFLNEDNEKSKDSIRSTIYNRAEEYIQELYSFETEYEMLAKEQGEGALPSLRKAVPNPKTFLHYITPKINAVRRSPELMLRIRNAQASDVSDACCSIGILGCLVELYNLSMQKLATITNKEEKYHDGDFIKAEIRKDRRFGQLLECASCGINIRARMQEFMSDYNNITDEANEDVSDSDEEENDDDAEKSEYLSISDSTRWLSGMIAIDIGEEVKIRSHNITGAVTSIATKALETLESEWLSYMQKGGDSDYLDEMIDITRALACARKKAQEAVDFYFERCVEILLKDADEVHEDSTNNEESELKVDEIIDKLHSAEDLELGDNSTSSDKKANETSIEASVDKEIETVDEESNTLLGTFSRQHKVQLLKTCLLFRSKKNSLLRKVQKELLDSLVLVLIDDLELILSLEEETDAHVIECVDAAIVLANLADVGNDSHLGIGQQKIVSRENERENGYTSPCFMNGNTQETLLALLDEANPISTAEIKVDFANSTYLDVAILNEYLPRTPDHFALEDNQIVRFDKSMLIENEKHTSKNTISKDMSEVSPKDTNLHVSSKVMQKAYDRAKNSLYDCSIIALGVDLIEPESKPIVLKACVRMIETAGIDLLDQLENADLTNLICGLVKLSASTPLSSRSASVLMTLFRVVLARNFETFELYELSRILEAIANVISTQRAPLIAKTLMNDHSVMKFIAHSMERMKCSDLVTIDMLANLAWAYAECNKLRSRSCWEHFEILGRCFAAVSSGLARGKQSEQMNLSTMYKTAFAVSLMDLDAFDINVEILRIARRKKNFWPKQHLLDKTRLLYAIAKSTQNADQSYTLDFSVSLNRCIDSVVKEKLDTLSPYNFACVVWSVGILRGEEVSAFMTNLPSYSRDELSVLSLTMIFRLLSGIVTVFDAEDIQTNSKIQLILKHLLSIIDTRTTQMIPKEICQYSQLLVDLKTSCYLEDDLEAKCLANKDIIVDDVENEEEESVISSLFPNSNRREIYELCTRIIDNLMKQTKEKIGSFTANEMTMIMKILGLHDQNDLYSCIKTEIDDRIHTVREHLSNLDTTSDEGSADETRETGRTYRSILKQIFVSDPAQDGDLSYSNEKKNDDVSQVIRILRESMHEEALNSLLLSTSFESAFNLGRCRWQTTRSLQGNPILQDETTFLFP